MKRAITTGRLSDIGGYPLSLRITEFFSGESNKNVPGKNNTGDYEIGFG
jgi:hypothetical protein